MGGLPLGRQISTPALFVIIASLGVLAPLAVLLLMRERAQAMLANWKDSLQPSALAMTGAGGALTLGARLASPARTLP
ncbi:hypothetical protein [Streptomyces sp. NPDC053427]|uniref:hypothetical protein n=1 Tax=Streptomyces sp. NPDC053427 TaxID=3365701 RepID=UPI0037D75296